jgi:hypothetical protein
MPVLVLIFSNFVFPRAGSHRLFARGKFSSRDDGLLSIKTTTVKKAAALLALHLLWVTSAHPQVLPDPSSYNKTDKELSDEYLRKNRHQRRTGLILLVAGVGIASLGASNSELHTTGASTMLYLGAMGAMGSVPLFLSASKNKEKGELLLRMQSMPLAGGKRGKVVGLGVGIRLGH